MLMSYFIILPSTKDSKGQGYQAIEDIDEDDDGVGTQQADPSYQPSSAPGGSEGTTKEMRTLSENLRNAKALVIP